MKTMFLASVAALALCASGAQAGLGINAGGVPGTAQPVHHAPANGLKTLYDQNSANAGFGNFSETLSSYPQYDEYAADDFTVPAGHNWKVKEVDVTGFYYQGGGGPASSVNVLFWTDRNNLPNSTKAKVECDNITPSSGLSTGVFGITLPNTCKVSLKGGASGKTYWVTVQANMKGPKTSGRWAWTMNTVIRGNMASVFDYGGSVQVNDPKCYSQFESLQDCYGDTYDLAFALYGKDK